MTAHIDAKLMSIDVLTDKPNDYPPSLIIPHTTSSRLSSSQQYINSIRNPRELFPLFVQQHRLIGKLLEHPATKAVINKHLDQICYEIHDPKNLKTHIRLWFIYFYDRSFSDYTNLTLDSVVLASNGVAVFWNNQDLVGIQNTIDFNGEFNEVWIFSTDNFGNTPMLIDLQDTRYSFFGFDDFEDVFLPLDPIYQEPPVDASTLMVDKA